MSGALQFLRNREGTSSLMFGLVSLPLFGAIGVLSDYSIAAETRTRLQTAIDATALKLARGNASLTDAQLQTQGDALVRAFMAGRGDVAIGSVSVTRANKRITLSAAGTVKARFATLIGGQGRTPISAATQTAWGVRKLEIVMVLDNTGSMSSSGKMDALKTAATNFINTMEAVAYEPDSVKISIVPFNTTVKVGTTYASATWLREKPGSWDGCVTDRDEPSDTNESDAIPGVWATLYPARLCPQANLAAIMPLTNDFSALRTRVSAMQPAGNTNVTIGVVWGMETLSDNAPMTGGVAWGNTEVDKVMIVLTDGENTESRHTNNNASMDAKTLAACGSAKARQIKVYTVRVINGDATLIRNCATTPSMYYNVTDAAQLNPVFQDIANSIQNIRLTN